MKTILIAAALIVGSTSLASAQSHTPRIDTREASQQARINQGVRSGRLSARETYNLERGQARVNRMENRAKADGVVTGRERTRITRAQNVQSAKIYNKKHNWR